ncbi:MAG: tetratricopeptide repeat protein [Alphaproteobacteria bacterium]
MAANNKLISQFVACALVACALVASGLVASTLVFAAVGSGIAFANTHAKLNKPGSQAPQSQAPQTQATHAPGDGAAINALFDRLREVDSTETAQPIANEIWRLWLRSGSDTVDLLVSRSQVLMRDRKFDQAVELLDTVVEIAPRYAEGWNKRATVYYLKGDYGQSIADVRQVLALEPRHFGALSGLGSMLREIGDPASALGAFRAALKLHPFLTGAAQAVEELTDEVEGRKI